LDWLQIVSDRSASVDRVQEGRVGKDRPPEVTDTCLSTAICSSGQQVHRDSLCRCYPTIVIAVYVLQPPLMVCASAILMTPGRAPMTQRCPHQILPYLMLGCTPSRVYAAERWPTVMMGRARKRMSWHGRCQALGFKRREEMARGPGRPACTFHIRTCLGTSETHARPTSSPPLQSNMVHSALDAASRQATHRQVLRNRHLDVGAECDIGRLASAQNPQTVIDLPVPG